MSRSSADKTLMYREAEEAHERVRLQLASNLEVIGTLAARLRHTAPALVVTCARGSSDHAATYAKYLIETLLGVPTMSAAPSVHSVFAAHQNLQNALFLAISQSGQSPDILNATQAAKDSGAYVVSLINDTTSPLAMLSDVVIPLHAGPEKSVAATKSYICSLSAIAHLVATWGRNQGLLDELAHLPDALKGAFNQDWPTAVDGIKNADNLFVISRGYGLAIAQEAALKFEETCSLHATAFSAAEVRHGPMAIVKEGFPTLILSIQDQTQPSIDEAVMAFIERGAKVFSAGQSYEGADNLANVTIAAPELRPILLIQSIYKFVNALAVARGYDPDCPPYLSKVTETL